MFLKYAELHVIVCIIIFHFLCDESSGLTLLSGQRIPSRGIKKGVEHYGNTASTRSIFDLPSVELWGEQNGLKEDHLKSLYRAVMNASRLVQNNSDGIYQCKLDHLVEDLILEGFPKRHVQNLMETFSIHCSIKHIEKSEGGYKFVIQLPSGKLVETVLIRHERHSGNVRYTVCVSSQVGCAKKCSFCATGTMGLQGQLSSSEILEQVFLAKLFLVDNASDGFIRNCVFMGMGEPLDNYDAVHEALRGLTHQCLYGLKAKQVTVSTVGANANKIIQLADEAPQVSLALSLHSALQSTREKLIPSARMSPMEVLGAALDYHSDKSGRGAMLEYLLIDGVNDSEADIEGLVDFCSQRRGRVFVNLIPYNPTLAGEGFAYKVPTDERIFAFHDRLKGLGINSLIRWSSANGRDTNGACGQLALSAYE